MAGISTSPREEEQGVRNGESFSVTLSFCPASPSSPTPQHLCSIGSWYPRFSDCTFRTEIIPISPAIADWLVQDGITLPDVDSAFPTRVRDAYASSDEYSNDDADDAGNDGDNVSCRTSECSASTASSDWAARVPAELPTLFGMIASSIERLGGAVVPKMQWSCPKDACWMLPNNTLRCTNANEVCLLLKSSDRTAHDVETMRRLLASDEDGAANGSGVRIERDDDDDDGNEDDALRETGAGDENQPASPRSTIGATGAAPPALCGKQHVIALRTYYDLKPGREFRCFVKNGTLCAISQRGQEYHQHLVDNCAAYKEKIVSFYETSIRPKLFLGDVVFDCYVPEGSSRLRLIDFNVFGVDSCTHAMLFSWDEIMDPELDGTDVSMRVVSDVASSGVIRPSETSLYGVPYDFVDEGVADQLSEFLAKASLSR